MGIDFGLAVHRVHIRVMVDLELSDMYNTEDDGTINMNRTRN